MAATIAVCGSGWMGRALGNAIATRGPYNVVFGSRSPGVKKGFHIAGEVKSFEDAILSATRIVILAVPPSAYKGLAEDYGHLLRDKVVIDISNAPNASTTADKSLAEGLQEMLSMSLVVKAFNTLSAYELTTKVDHGVSKAVKMCGNNGRAVEAVQRLVEDMGMTPLVMGSLQAARHMEASQHELFPTWRVPSVIVGVFFIFNFIYALVWYCFLDIPGYGQPAEKTAQLPAKVMNTIIANTGITTLSAVFLAGSAASITQLIRRDARRAFPGWLSAWLNARKEMGLIAFWLIIMHAILVTLQLSSDSYYSLYKFNPATYAFGKLSAYGEAVLLLGVFAFASMLIMAINSTPSIAERLSYAEWRFIFSWLGYLTLAISFAHTLLYAITYSTCDVCKGHGSFGSTWPVNSTGGHVPPPAMLTIGISGLTLLLRFILALPPISLYLAKLRKDGVVHKHKRVVTTTHTELTPDVARGVSPARDAPVVKPGKAFSTPSDSGSSSRESAV